MARFDVLLPYYGDVRFLQLAVRSVISQADSDWRLVVIDDGYPGLQVRQWFSRMRDPRIEYHRNSNNMGANANYRHALTFAKASHIIFMGADDIMLPNYLTVIRRVIQRHPSASVIQPGVEIIDNNGRIASTLTDRVKHRMWPRDTTAVLRGEALCVSLLRGNWTYFPSLCWNAATLTNRTFRPNFDVVQDLALLLDIAAAGGSLAVDSELAFLYRRHQGSDSAQRTASGVRFREERELFRSAVLQFQTQGWSRAARAARLHLTSRLHAAKLLPEAVLNRSPGVPGQLLRHALGRL